MSNQGLAAATGQEFVDVDSNTERMFEENQGKVPQVFTTFFRGNLLANQKILDSTANPSISQQQSEGEVLIEESLQKDKKKTKRPSNKSGIAT